MSLQRIDWVDTLRGFGIILVFLGHTTLTDRTLEHYIFSFHMPLFFFIAGFFFKATGSFRSFRDFLLARIAARIVPYVSFGLLTYCIWLLPFLLRRFGIYQGSSPFPNSLFLKPLIGMLYGVGDGNWLPHNGILWFLACLFVTEILFFVISSFARSKLTLLTALFVFAVIGYIDSLYLPVRLPFSFDVALTAVVFYGLGYLLKDYLFSSDLGIGSAFLCLLLGFTIGFFNERVDMNYSCYGNPLLFYASSLSTIYAYVCFAKRIPVYRPIAYVGKNALSFFLLQNIGFLVINGLAYLSLRTRPNSLDPNTIYAVGYVLLAILVLFPAVYFINNKIPLITGKPARNRDQKLDLKAQWI